MVSACDNLDFTERKWLDFLDTLNASNQLDLFKLLLEKKGALLSQEIKNRALLHIFRKESSKMTEEIHSWINSGRGSPIDYLEDSYIEHQITWLRTALLYQDNNHMLEVSFLGKIDPNVLERDDSSLFHAEFTTAWFLSQAPDREEKIRILREHGWTGSET
jgi:hypothetical protein